MEYLLHSALFLDQIPTDHNRTDKADSRHIGISIGPGQLHRSPFRLYRIFGRLMNHVAFPVLPSWSKIGLLLLLSIAGWRCLEAPNFPDEPYIEFLSISKDSLQQGIFQEDSLMVTFRFEDGDGDLGRTDQEPDNNIFFIDERTGTLDNTFAIPTIPQ